MAEHPVSDWHVWNVRTTLRGHDRSRKERAWDADASRTAACSLFEVLLPDSDKLWPEWLERIDTLLEDEAVIDPVAAALKQRWPQSLKRGSAGTPGELRRPAGCPTGRSSSTTGAWPCRPRPRSTAPSSPS